MEVAGRKQHKKQLPAAKGNQVEILCKPCKNESVNIHANGYCEACNIFICTSCVRAHRKLPLTKNHVIKSGKEMPRNLVLTDPCTELCSTHKTTFVRFYCRSHDEVGCGECMVAKHKACQVDRVPDVSESYDNIEAMRRFRQQAEYLVKEITYRKTVIKGNLKSVVSLQLKVAGEIKRFRKEINDCLDKAEKELLNEVENLKKTDVNLQNKLHDECDSIQKEIEAFKKTLDTNEKQLNDLFVCAKVAQQELKAHQEAVERIASESRIKFYKFKPDQKSMAMKMTGPVLGHIYVKAPTVNMKAEFVKKINIKAADEKIKCNITGFVRLSADKILLADVDNVTLKIVSLNESKIISKNRLMCRHVPFDITVIDREQAAVTLPDGQTIMFINTTDGLSESHYIYVGGKCYGIDHKDGKLVVSFCMPPTVKILTMQGRVLHDLGNTGMFWFPYYLAFSRYNDSIFVSDYEKHAVYELTSDGKIEAKISCGDGSFPRGLAVTNDGTVIVCCEAISNRVNMIAPNSSDVLPLHVNDVQRPSTIFVCEEQNKMYIGEYCISKDRNHIKIFDMKFP